MSIRNLFKQLLAITFISLPAALSALNSDIVSTPDFAFPQKVTKASLSAMNTALKNGNDIEAIRSLMDYAIAQASIGNDNSKKIISKIDSVIPNLKAPESTSLVKLLKAQIYSDIYSSNKYLYDNRNLPLNPLPDDYTEWSGEQFRQVISDLCDESLRPTTALQKANLDKYTSIINIAHGELTYYPTLFDFVAYRTIELRTGLSEFSNSLSILLMTPRTTFVLQPKYVPMSIQAEKILDTYSDLLKFHANNIAPLIIADINRLNFIENNVYNSMSDAAENTYNRLLMDLYSEYKSSEYSGLILSEIRYSDYDYSEKTYLYNLIKVFCEKFPNSNIIGCLNNILAEISKKSIEMQSSLNVSPKLDFPLVVNVENVKDLTIKVLKVDYDPFEPSINLGKAKSHLIKTIPLSFENDIPFKAQKKCLLNLPEPGKYVVITDIDDKTNTADNYIRPILCTEMSMELINAENNRQVVAVYGNSGIPIADATVNLRPFKDRTNIQEIGKTGSDGILQLEKSQNGLLYVKKDGLGCSQPGSSPSIYSTYTDWKIDGQAFTSLAIYKPGDTVEFNSIIYEYRGQNYRLKKNYSIDALLYNTNRIYIDTLKLRTDDWGRCNGSFSIPKGELTGNYGILIQGNSNSGTNRIICNKTFMVSDYKLPTFYVDINSILTSTDKDQTGDLTIAGKVKTYSGMGLGNIPLKYTLSVSSQLWWRALNSIDFYSESDSTEANGLFSIVISKKMLAYSPDPNGLYTIRIEATTDAGESQQCTKSFSIGNVLTLMADIPDNINVTNATPLSIKVLRSDMQPIDTIIPYSLRNSSNNAVVSHGTIKTSNPTVNWTKIPSGQYSLELKSFTQTEDSIKSYNVILFRPNDKKSPASVPFWMPYTKDQPIVLDRQSRATLLYATTAPETYILKTLSDGNKIISQEWIKTKSGMHTLNISVPADLISPNINLITIQNFCKYEYNLDLKYNKAQSIKIIAETFRDKVIPGNEETWTFRVVNQDSTSTSAALIMDMYNSALDALRSDSWNYIKRHDYIYKTNVEFVGEGSYSYRILLPYTSAMCTSHSTPRFKLYGYPLFNNYRLSFGRNRMMLKSASSGAMDIVDYSMPTAAHEETLSIDEIATTPEFNIRGEQQNPTNNNPVFEYRESETPLAFYKPTLNTDSEGRLSVSFRVPNANTTWKLRALAFTDSLLTDLYSANIIANKPVMVQPNLPRFVRTGDSIDINALVMNNSDSDESISTTIELFNPTNEKIISDTTICQTVKANNTATASIRFFAPEDMTFVGYRVKSASATFADGEQSVIPILQSTTPVIETLPFYISPDSTTFNMKLPETGTEANVTLQYCDNPTWLAVTALPGLRSGQMSTPSDASNAIFSAAVAEGLLKDYPAIDEALRQWTSSDRSDSTLVSMLQRNSDLKTILLQATPWMVDAMNDTERMQRLALLFDKKEISEVYSAAIGLLKKLQRDNGGWAWINQSETTSQWATEDALYTFGYLNQLGYMPKDKELAKMIEQALDWDQKEVVKQYKKYPTSSFRKFLIIRDQWPSFTPSAEGKRIISNEIQKIVKNWKKYSVGDKAVAARLLYNNGYKQLSRTVLASLKEYAECSATKGMWWPSLGDSFGGSLLQLGVASDALLTLYTIEPQSTDIDLIRQWLILQKEAQNWGSGSMTTQIIAAIIKTSPKWLNKASEVSMDIDGSAIDFKYNDSLIGDFRKNITDMNPSGAILTINKSTGTPSWGAVYSRSIKKMDMVEPSSCEAVSIEKKYFKADGTEWIKSSDFKVGDRVKVQLLIHATRDMQYMAITDDRAACLEPVEQLPTPIYSEGLCFYRENRDAFTNIFVTNMPKGTYLLEYELWVNNAGEFSSGIATIQSQYAPELSAHSSGTIINVGENLVKKP